MLADIHHWERKGFKLVALAEAKPFLTLGQREDQGKKDPERQGGRKSRQEHPPTKFRSTVFPSRDY